MRKKLLRMATPLCLCLLIFAPFARAMQSTSPQSQEDIDQTNGAIENLCAPAVNTESSKELMNFALDYEQLAPRVSALLSRDSGWLGAARPVEECVVDLPHSIR